MRKKKDSSVSRKKEIVQRDGEEVVRVRSKRRRSKQKKNEISQGVLNKIFWRSFLVVGLGVSLAGAYTLRMLYVNGPKYEAKLIHALEEHHGADITLDGLSFAPKQISLAHLEYTKEADFFKGLELFNIQMPHHTLGAITGNWKGSVVEASDGILRFNTTQNFNFNFSPALELNANELYVKTMNVFTGGYEPLLSGVECSIASGIITFEGGTVSIPLFEKTELKKLSVYIREKTLLEGELILNESITEVKGVLSDEEISIQIGIVPLNPIHIEPSQAYLVHDQIEGLDIRYKVNRESVELEGKFNSLFKAHRVDPLANIIRKLAPEGYIATLDKGPLEGELDYQNGYLSISSSLYTSPFSYHAKFNFKEGSSKTELVLSFPLAWEKKLALYPQLQNIVTIENESYQLKCSLWSEGGKILDDLDSRIFQLEQGSREKNLESLEKQLDQLIK